MDEPFEPVQFGRYQLVEQLAKGGMAEIFKAKSHGAHGFEKTLVVKRILPHLAKDPKFIEMFIDEAKVMVQINHPKVVQVLDFGEVDNQYFIAMEYVEGVDGLALLRMCVRRGLRPKAAIAVHIVAEVLDALHFAHTLTDDNKRPLQVLHRDISPSNIFISDQGEVKLGDFGIARSAVPNSATDAKNLKGKYGYLCPELIAGGSLDQRSDLFSAGVVLAELLMVRRLFVSSSDLQVLLRVRDANLDRIDTYGKHIPPDLRQILDASLARDPALRYQDAASFRDALHRYLYDHRLMVRHTDVRRFLRRLRGQKDDVSRPNLERLLAEGGTEPTPIPGSPDPKALEKKDRTMTGFPKPPSADGERRSSRDLRDTDDAPTTEAPAIDNPRERPSMVDNRPSVNTEYSSITRERILIRPNRRGAVEGQRAPTPARPRPNAMGKALPSAPGILRRQAEARRSPSSGETTSPFQRIGRKRKIALGPPPRPRPVPNSGDEGGEELNPGDLSDEGLVDVGSLGSNPDWDGNTSRSVDILEAVRQALVESGEIEPNADAPTPPYKTPTPKPLPRADRAEPCDFEGDFTKSSPLSLLFKLAMDEETGLLVLSDGPTIKEVYLVDGDPHFVASNRPEELFGQYLVRKGAVSKGELSMALAMLPHFKGKLGSTLIGLKLLRPVQVIRFLTQQVREMLLDAFCRDNGTYRFYRDQRCQQEAAPLGLTAFEVIGSVVQSLDERQVRARLKPMRDSVPVPINPLPVPPEVFRLGSGPREAIDSLDGQRTINDLLAPFDDTSQACEFGRMVVLLLETNLVKAK